MSKETQIYIPKSHVKPRTLPDRISCVNNKRLPATDTGWIWNRLKISYQIKTPPFSMGLFVPAPLGWPAKWITELGEKSKSAWPDNSPVRQQVVRSVVIMLERYFELGLPKWTTWDNAKRHMEILKVVHKKFQLFP